MDQGSQELRRAAAKAFEQAIAQLETTLQLPDEDPDLTTSPPKNAKQQADSANSAFDLDALADAAADIEQFIQAKTQLPNEPPESKE